MADLTTRLELVPWPIGTSVSAYQRKSDLRLADGPPPGIPASQTAVVAADHSLSFTLPAGVYWAIAPLTAGLRDFFYLGFELVERATEVLIPGPAGPQGAKGEKGDAGGGGTFTLDWVNTVDDRPAATADQIVGVRATNTLYRWDGQTWQPIAGSGAQGNLPPSGTPANLFVSQIQPSPASMVLDSLWIPVDGSGNPAPLKDWQVFTGTGDGDGGNLIISQTQPPTPAIDTLWIPLASSGLPVDVYSWKVYSGLGSVVGVGNANLVFGTSLPTGIPDGSLFVALNSNQTPKTIDNWRVYA